MNVQTGSNDVDGRAFAALKGLRPRRRDKPGHDTCNCDVMGLRKSQNQAASAALAFSAIAWNAVGSWMARSDNTLRSTVMPDLDRPLINTL